VLVLSKKIIAVQIVFIFLMLSLFPIGAYCQFVENHVGYAFENPGFLSMPGPLAYDQGRHRLAVSDGGRGLIYIFDLADRTISQTLGADNKLKEPQGLAFDNKGALYVTQKDSPYLLKFSLSAVQPEIIQLKLVGNDIHPGKITIGDDGKIFIADKKKAAIYIFDFGDTLVTQITKKLHQPNGILVESSGALLIADKGIDPVLEFAADGEYLRRLSRPESPTSQVSFEASGLARDQSGWIYTLDITHFKLISYDPSGVNRVEWAPSDPPFFPEDIAIDRYGYIYISERGSGQVLIFSRGN
jgi:sugar lactone lactonase YvrE